VRGTNESFLLAYMYMHLGSIPGMKSDLTPWSQADSMDGCTQLVWVIAAGIAITFHVQKRRGRLCQPWSFL
jgi:hypothetical protein